MNPLKRKMPAWFFGLICGLLLTIYVQVLDMTQIIYTTSWGAYIGYLAILILPTCIFLTLREIKRKYQSLRFTQAIGAGLLVSCVAATTYSAYTFVDIHFFDARHLKNLFDYTVNSMQKAGRSATEIQKRLTEMKAHYFSLKPYISTYLWYLVMGAFFSIVFYFLLRMSNSKQTSI